MHRTHLPPRPAIRSSLAEQAAIAVARLADALMRGAEEVFRPSELSAPQYNVLRILRGAGEEGLACRQIGDRLISRDPDITRLLDRLEARGLITRARETEDRRVVKTRITEKGLRLLADMDEPVQEFHRRKLGRMPEKQLRQFLRLLERALEVAKEAETLDLHSNESKLSGHES